MARSVLLSADESKAELRRILDDALERNGKQQEASD